MSRGLGDVYKRQVGLIMDLFRKVMLQRKASYLNLTMRAYDYIIVTEIITNVLAGLIYGE